jgi:hypothetical protein
MYVHVLSMTYCDIQVVHNQSVNMTDMQMSTDTLSPWIFVAKHDLIMYLPMWQGGQMVYFQTKYPN